MYIITYLITTIKDEYYITNDEKDMKETYKRLSDNNFVSNIKVYQATEIFMEEQ